MSPFHQSIEFEAFVHMTSWTNILPICHGYSENVNSFQINYVLVRVNKHVLRFIEHSHLTLDLARTCLLIFWCHRTAPPTLEHFLVNDHACKTLEQTSSSEILQPIYMQPIAWLRAAVWYHSFKEKFKVD